MTRPRTDARAGVGAAGEEVAARFLAGRGARILARNLALPTGEIDILALLDGERVAVEVRTVRGGRRAVDAFDEEKADRVWRLARSLRPPATRVDLVAVRFSQEGADVHWVKRIG